MLELLIAMVLLASIVALVISSIRIGFRSVDTGDRLITSMERVRTSLHVFEAHLLSALKIHLRKGMPAGEQPKQFVGDSRRISFQSVHSLWGGSRGPVTVTYRVSDDGDGRQSLLLTESPSMVDMPRETVLFQHVEAVEFSFFSRTPTDEIGTWMKEWKETERFPERVRMEVRKDRRMLTVMVSVPIAGADRILVSGKAITP